MKINKELKELVDHFLNIKDQPEMLDFLSSILTPSELEEVTQRLQIVKMLKKGVSQRDIAQKLGVGIATVTRGSREIKKGGFKSVE